MDSFGLGMGQDMLLPLQADAQLAIGKARRRACVGRRRAEGGRRSFIGSAARRCSPAPGRWARPRRPIETGIEVARRQNAKSWELRGAMSLARLHRQQSRHEEAVALLAPVYGWLTEGFDAADLQAARTLLNDLEIERDALPSAERNKSAG